MKKLLDQIRKIGIVPVVVLDDAKDAKSLAKALCEGGLPCAEVTFRTDAAEESIRVMTRNFPQMLVGAGTVLTTKQVDQAVDAGANFIVSPGLNPKIVTYCMKRNIPIIPGTAHPSDVEQALELGLEAVKFFPAESAGGIKMIKAISAPYTNMEFMPTGGISEKNINEYLSYSKVIACGGSWMVKSDLIKDGAFDIITKLTKEAVRLMLGFEVMHVGINCEDDDQALQTAQKFGRIFGFENKNGMSSIFAGKGIEVMKNRYLGRNGHIAVGTNHLDRAVYYLEEQGVAFDMDTAKYKNGKLAAVYLKEETAGFAIHLMQK